MPRILVFQHAPSEVLGTLDPLLRAAGFRIRYANFGRFPDLEVSLDGYDGLIVLGGPQNVDELDLYPHLGRELRLIDKAVGGGLSVLGVCLGAQLLAACLGARVLSNHAKEIGWYDLIPEPEAASDPLLCHLAAPEKVFQWHGYTFELPRGAVPLARTEDCVRQAFRYGDRVYGFQFHLEVDARMAERWLNVPGNRRELASLRGKIDPERIRADTKLYGVRQAELGARVFGAFVSLLGPARKFRQLGSR